jgi:hypothetical protein
VRAARGAGLQQVHEHSLGVRVASFDLVSSREKDLRETDNIQRALRA